MTLLSVAVPPARRGLALGAWGAIAGLAIAVGPVVGGAIVEGASWSWIFWLNVPIGIALLPVAVALLKESHGPCVRSSTSSAPASPPPACSRSCSVWSRRPTGAGAARSIVGLFVVGAVFLAAFVTWERRAPSPVLPMRLFRNRGFTASNVASLFMFFGMFGSIFLLAQFLQVAHHYSPLSAGVRTLPWTAMPIFVAPVAGLLSDRIGGRRIVVDRVCSCRPSGSTGWQ